MKRIPMIAALVVIGAVSTYLYLEWTGEPRSTSPEPSRVSSTPVRKTMPEDAMQALARSAPLPLVAISPGSFRMGSERVETWEQQAHKVTLTKPFYMGATEVTQAQYLSVMKDNPSIFEGEDLPVESVSWENAVEFCRRLTESERLKNNLPEGIVYRLPTEAEW